MATTLPKESQRKNYGSDKFRATKVWKQVVREFQTRIADNNSQSNVSAVVSWRRPKCFSGADAVEILTGFLIEKRESLGLKEVTREKAMKFCEILLRDNTIVPAPENKNGKRFEPSKTAFYYFNDLSSSSLPGTSGDIDDKENLRRFVTPKSCRNVALRSSVCSSMSVEDVGDLDEKIVRDFALSRLLTLVEIPVLEGILHIRTEDESGSMLKTLENLFGGLKLAFNMNVRSPDTSEMEETTLPETNDPWILAASQCVNACRSNLDPSALQSREMLYRNVLSAYKTVSSKRGPLIPHQYDEILAQILQLIAIGTPEDKAKALEACQCLGLLLPKETRRQLGALLTFLTIDSREEMEEPKTFNMDLAMSMDTIAKIVFPKESLDNCRLMHFYLANAQSILSFPKDFKEHVYYCQTVLLHSSMDPKPEMTFCNRITAEEYQRQALTATEQALYETLSNVVESESMSDKEKCRWFEKFRLEYPKIYEARFPSLLK